MTLKAKAIRQRRRRRNAVKVAPAAPTTRRGVRTREELKEAAIQAINARGYAAVRIADITDGMGAPASLFYRYFQSKQALALEILADFQQTMIDQLHSAAGDTAFARIHAANLILTRTYESNPGLMRCLVTFDFHEPQCFDAFRKAWGDWHQRIAVSMARRVPGAQVSEAERLQLAHMAAAMVEQLLCDLYILRQPDLRAALPTPEDAALFLSVLWHRLVFMTDPPTDQMGRFEELSRLKLAA